MSADEAKLEAPAKSRAESPDAGEVHARLQQVGNMSVSVPVSWTLKQYGQTAYALLPFTAAGAEPDHLMLLASMAINDQTLSNANQMKAHWDRVGFRGPAPEPFFVTQPGVECLRAEGELPHAKEPGKTVPFVSIGCRSPRNHNVIEWSAQTAAAMRKHGPELERIVTTVRFLDAP